MYIQATELAGILPANVSIGTNTTPLTLGEVGTIITEVSARFDAAAEAAGYAMPALSSASSYPLVQQIVKDGVGARVLNILFPNPRNPLAQDYEDAFNAALKALASSDLVLPGVPGSSSEDVRLLPRSFSHVAADPLQGGATAYIDRVWEP